MGLHVSFMQCRYIDWFFTTPLLLLDILLLANVTFGTALWFAAPPYCLESNKDPTSM